MSETKSHQFRPPLYGDGAAKRNGAPERGTAGGPGREPGREQKGWEAYRKWLSSMSGKPRRERAPIDHSVYSWKGYHSWADRVRQSWKPEEG